MPRDHFTFRKKNQLEKDDKSLKSSRDKKIISLCEKINTLDNYYTTSSCSGRVVLLKDSRDKRDDLFIRVWHDRTSFEELKETLNNINSEDLIYFKQDPVIMHVACKTLEDAQKLIELAMESGWKRNGIISSDKRFVVELNATDKLEFPVFHKKVLVNDDYLKLIVEEANKKLELSWGKIKRLESSVETLKYL